MSSAAAPVNQFSPLRAVPISAASALKPSGAEVRARALISSLATAGWLSDEEATRMNDAICASNIHMLAAISGALEAYRLKLSAGAEAVARSGAARIPASSGPTAWGSEAAAAAAAAPMPAVSPEAVAPPKAWAPAADCAARLPGQSVEAASTDVYTRADPGGGDALPAAPPLPPTATFDVLTHPDVLFACGDLVETLRITLRSAFLM
jgi:hypothetical protein